jgi:hypothetical protein
MSRLSSFIGILGVSALAACGSETGPPVPAAMTIASGDHQSWSGRSRLPFPLVVSVTTASGEPVPNISVDWEVTSGGGRVDPATSVTDGAGHASVIWTVGTSGNQSVRASVAGAPNPSVTFSATLLNLIPVALHFDGTTWSVAVDISDPYISEIVVKSLWGASSTAVVAGGECGDEFILRYDGTKWLVQICYTATIRHDAMLSVSGTSASDFFVLVRTYFAGGDLSNHISHYDGQSMAVSYESPRCSGLQPPFCSRIGLQSLWSRSSVDVFAVGDSGKVLHYDGSWTTQETGTTALLSGVWGDPASSAVFAVGDGGTILYYDGSTWQAQTSGTSKPLTAVWGASPTNVFAVGGSGTILHFDGTSWTAQNSGTASTFHSVWGSSGNSVFAVGDGGTIAHYDGQTWTTHTVPRYSSLNAVWGTSGTNVYAVGASK